MKVNYFNKFIIKNAFVFSEEVHDLSIIISLTKSFGVIIDKWLYRNPFRYWMMVIKLNNLVINFDKLEYSNIEQSQ